MAVIQDGSVGSQIAGVDATPKALRTAIYDALANLLAPSNKAAIAATAGGILLAGNDYKAARSLRADETGTLRTTQETLFLYDSIEGAAVNTNTWLQTTATMTIDQAAATGVRLNANATLSITTGAMHTSNRTFPKIPGCPLLARMRFSPKTHQTGNLHELGFGNPGTSTTTSLGNGAIWRKDSAGQWLPVVIINNVETLGTPISNATFIASIPVTDYAMFTVEVRHSLFRFAIYKQDGTLVTSQDIDLSAGAAGISGFAVTHLNLYYRTYNSAAVSTAVQPVMDEVSVIGQDMFNTRDFRVALSGAGFSSLVSPTTYAQNANWTNSAAPTTRTLANVTAAETTLGGLLRVNAVAGAATDYIMFGWQNPSPYTFYCDSIYIPIPLNEVAAVATTAFVIAYFAAFNSSAVSLATGAPSPPQRIALPGMHTAAVGLAANLLFSGNVIQVTFPTPFAVQPGKFLHIGCRVLVGTATATETIQWAGTAIGGFFE